MITLTYFEGYGLAEQIRWVLSFTEGTAWKNVGLTEASQFQDMKDDKKLLFNQLPLLVIDGMNLVQSQAIIRHLARRSKMDGKTDADKVKVDMICDCIRDCRGPVVQYPFSEDKNQTKLNAELMVGKFFPFLEDLIQEDSFLGYITVADILLAELMHEMFFLIDRSNVEKYHRCMAVYQIITESRNITAYLESDKRYPFPDGEDGKVYCENVNRVLSR